MSDQIIGREEEGKSDTDLNNLQENSTNSPSISPIPLPEPTTTTTTIVSTDMNDNHHQRGISSLNSVITSKRTKEPTMSSSDLSELGEDMDDHFVTATEEIIEPNRISNRSLITSTDLENSDDDDEEIVEISRRRNKRQKIRNLDDDGDSEFHTDNNNNQRDTSNNNNIDLDIDEDESIIISEEVPIIRRSERNGNRRHIGDSNSGSTRGSTTPGTGSNSVFQSEGIEIQELDSDNDNNDNDINDDVDDDITTTTSGSRNNN
ncbi:unnamed protein product [[Candida] boidinii]|nr:unnamed protein product [[Candida] boidinii]